MAFLRAGVSAVQAQAARHTATGGDRRTHQRRAELRRAEINSLSTAPLSETPLSVGVISADRLRERGAGSLSAAIRDEPAAADAYNTIGYIDDVAGARLSPR